MTLTTYILAVITIYFVSLTIMFKKDILKNFSETVVLGIFLYLVLVVLEFHGVEGELGNKFSLLSFSIEKFQKEGIQGFASAFYFLGMLILLYIFALFSKVIDLSEIAFIFQNAFAFIALNISFFGNLVNYFFFIFYLTVMWYYELEIKAIQKVANTNKL